MNRTKRRTARIIYGLGMSLYALGLALAMNGCFGYVQGDGGGGVVVAEPDVYLFGGYGDGGRAHDFGRRGGESRGSGGHGGGGRR
jgi:hypothetical protein